MGRFSLVSLLVSLFASGCAASDRPLPVSDEAVTSASAFFAILGTGGAGIINGNSMFQLATVEAGTFVQKTFIPGGREQLPTYLAANPICVRTWQVQKQFKYGHSEFSHDWALLGTVSLCDGRQRYFELTTDAKRRFYRSFAISDQPSLLLGRYRK